MIQERNRQFRDRSMWVWDRSPSQQADSTNPIQTSCVPYIAPGRPLQAFLVWTILNAYVYSVATYIGWEGYGMVPPGPGNKYLVHLLQKPTYPFQWLVPSWGTTSLSLSQAIPWLVLIYNGRHQSGRLKAWPSLGSLSSPLVTPFQGTFWRLRCRRTEGTWSIATGS